MNEIKELRLASNMSQSKFSAYLEIPLTNIQHWEQGVSTPPSYVTKLIKRVMVADQIIATSLSVHEDK